MRWRLFLDQFDRTINYIEGKKNVLADCFLRLPLMKKPSVGDKELQGKGKLIDFSQIELPKDDEEILDGETFQADPAVSEAEAFVQSVLKKYQRKEAVATDRNDESFYQDLNKCLLNLPSLEVMDNPITINHIINHQARDIPLQQSIMRDPDNYQHQGMQGFEVICKIEPESD